MNRRNAAGLALVPLALIVAGCGSGGTKPVALPSISAAASSPAASAAAASSPAASSPADTPSVTPTLISETISPASGTPSPSEAPISSTLATYRNARFGFSVKYPADFVKASPPVNGDGQLFNSPDQAASVTVSGVNNNNHQTVAQAYAAAIDPTDGSKITYSNRTGNIVTVSGITGTRVFYTRQVIGSGSIDSLSWTYPVADKATFDPVVTATADNFTAGDLSASH